MEYPKYYKGYDEEGGVVGIRRGEDADNYINPDTVHAKINNVENAMDESLEAIKSALRTIMTDADRALIVNGLNLNPQIQEIIEEIEKVKRFTGDMIEPIYEQALHAHDEKQRECNQRAKNALINAGAVTFDSYY